MMSRVPDGLHIGPWTGILDPRTGGRSFTPPVVGGCHRESPMPILGGQMKSGACPFFFGIHWGTGVIAGKETPRCFSVLLLGLLLALGCRPRPETVHLGIPLRLSGDEGPGRHQLLQAIQMRVDELNAKGGVGGRRIDLVIQDLGTTPEAGRKAIEALGADARVSALVGLDDPQTAITCAAACGQAKIPLLSPTIGDAEFLSQNPWVFTLTHPI